MKKFACITLALLLFAVIVHSQLLRERISIDKGWRFAFGNASDMVKDYTHGTEYFTYLCKVKSFDHNRGPIWNKFEDSNWTEVDLPHDWAVDLPFAPEASYSHGYKTVGFKYPETSVGWYRRHFAVDSSDLGRHIYVQFDGIFRDAQVFCNGFYLGHEQSGYATQVYDITDYLNYGGDNFLTVRADASLEEGWFYEGAGIYRHVWLNKTDPVHVAPFGTFVSCQLNDKNRAATLSVATEVVNSGLESSKFTVKQRLLDNKGMQVASANEASGELMGKSSTELKQTLSVNNPNLWSLESPYLYTLVTDVFADGRKVDSYSTTTGIRSICFDADNGFLLNGKQVKIKGTNVHQDHAGVGAGIPDALNEYRIKCLKSMGSNAIRCSHNPATPELLDICDREGILVLAENRLMGITQEHIDLLQRMIKRDRNHPSIILWSIGNEEWAIEGNETGRRIALSMSEYVHRMDSTRLTTAGIAGGQVLLYGLDVKGYNYIAQNDVDGFRKKYPDWKIVGTEETSGCGTRGIYETDSTKGWMNSFNRGGKEGVTNIIERGWKFYAERPWAAGLFYWTGFDYRGEAWPMTYPATNSQFGILDYCGFPKDEAYYLKSWWSNEPVLHIFPHWNLSGHEGDTVSVWAYSNCDEVELFVNGKSLGRKPMPVNGHLEWTAVYKPGKLFAHGYKNGKKSISETIETTGNATKIAAIANKSQLKADGCDVAVVDLQLLDSKNRFVPTAMNELDIEIVGNARIIGVGNGNPGYLDGERPLKNKKHYNVKAFNGKAQVIIQSEMQSGRVKVNVKGEGLSQSEINIDAL